MEARSALVLSTDALAAALLGALVEIEGYRLYFVKDGEPARAALRRVWPEVALVDCDFPDGCSAAFIGPARMIGTRVVVFGRPAAAAQVRACAKEFQVATLAMPPAPGELRRALAP